MFKIYYCNLSQILVLYFYVYLCVCNTENIWKDQNVQNKLALFLVMYIPTLWLLMKIDIEMAILAVRQI